MKFAFGFLDISLESISFLTVRRPCTFAFVSARASAQ